MADGIKLRLARGDMNVFRTDDRVGERVRVHVAGRHPAALCPSCAHPSVDTNGTGWRDVIDVVRTLVDHRVNNTDVIRCPHATTSVDIAGRRPSGVGVLDTSGNGGIPHGQAGPHRPDGR